MIMSGISSKLPKYPREVRDKSKWERKDWRHDRERVHERDVRPERDMRPDTDLRR